MARVRYFAAAAEAVGRDAEIRSEVSVALLRSALTEEHPQLVSLLPRCAVLVDGVRVQDATVLGEDTLVDVLPPFAGG